MRLRLANYLFHISMPHYKLKFIFGYLLLGAFIFSGRAAMAQFGENKERKKVLSGWNISKRKRRKMDAYNPYIDKSTGKSKHLSSKKLARENARTEKEQKKMIRKQKRKLRREGKGYKKVKS